MKVFVYFTLFLLFVSGGTATTYRTLPVAPLPTIIYSTVPQVSSIPRSSTIFYRPEPTIIHRTYSTYGQIPVVYSTIPSKGSVITYYGNGKTY
ncbi:uncharacterized protein LOC129607096 isoform X2 [Condylostylus longicornis]|uniref:uncharacterized protein LOC129607096 isoform X2 n=1 Tax=Condylostylus longicornis TaxID=2530218 RepID=UPI00244E4F5F|nr:uncharacterized protein LOC129607096 isoform X2 [Condylostylus longicornis]